MTEHDEELFRFMIDPDAYVLQDATCPWLGVSSARPGCGRRAHSGTWVSSGLQAKRREDKTQDATMTEHDEELLQFMNDDAWVLALLE